MPRPKTEKTCRSCRSCTVAEEFNQETAKIGPSKTTGFCRRYPPVLSGPTQSSFPPVKLDGWACDEWKKAQ